MLLVKITNWFVVASHVLSSPSTDRSDIDSGFCAAIVRQRIRENAGHMADVLFVPRAITVCCRRFGGRGGPQKHKAHKNRAPSVYTAIYSCDQRALPYVLTPKLHNHEKTPASRWATWVSEVGDEGLEKTPKTLGNQAFLRQWFHRWFHFSPTHHPNASAL